MNEKREIVLRSPEMFIGHPWDAAGLYFLLSNIMRLAIEPESANLCSNLKVIIEDEVVISIIDDGRGLPIEPVRIDKSVQKSKIEHVFSWIFTTNPLPAYYDKFGFLNYLGFVLNVVSGQLQIATHYRGHRYELACARGEIVNSLRRTSDTTIQDKGTRVTFSPDPTLFPHFKFEFERLYATLGELKHDFPLVTIVLEDKIACRKVEIKDHT